MSMGNTYKPISVGNIYRLKLISVDNIFVSNTYGSMFVDNIKILIIIILT